MAQSHFDFTGSLTGSISGSALMHNTLTNPLSGEGAYCRQFNLQLVNGQRGVSARCNSSAASGVLIGVPNNKTISLRAWVRSDTYNSIALSCKSVLTTSSAGDMSGLPGYHLVFGGPSGSNTGMVKLALVCATRGAGFAADKVFQISAFAMRTWVKLRMDVEAINDDNLGDRIKVYTGTGTTGSEVWTLLYTKDIFPGSNTGYISWNHASYKLNGFSVANVGYNTSMYIDRFQATAI